VETRLSNLKFVALTALELLAFNAEKITDHVTLATPLFENFLVIYSDPESEKRSLSH